MAKYSSWPTTNQGNIVSGRVKVEVRNRFDDAMSVLSATDQKDAALAELLATTGEGFSVKSYGAKGDGVADDTVAVEATLDAVIAAGGGQVFFPAGTYLISTIPEKTITTTGIKLSGVGRSSVIQITNTAGTAGLTFENGGSNVQNTIEDLHFVGNASSGPLLLLKNWFRTSELRNCLFRANDGDYAMEVQHCLGMRISNCFVADGFGGLHIKGLSDALVVEQLTVLGYSDIGTTGRAIKSSELTKGAETARTPRHMTINNLYTRAGNSTITNVIGVDLVDAGQTVVSNMWSELNETAVNLRHDDPDVSGGANNLFHIFNLIRGGSEQPIVNITNCNSGWFEIGDGTITIASNSIRNHVFLTNSSDVTDGSSNNQNNIFSKDGIVRGVAASVFVPGSTSLAFRNNADNANNLLLTDAGNGAFRGVLTTPTVTTLANEDTPTVAAGNLFQTGGTTTITDLDDGVVGQTIKILSGHAITITDGTNILLNGSANFVMAAGDVLVLTMYNDQVWVEDSRQVN